MTTEQTNFPANWSYSGPIGSIVIESHGYKLVRSSGPFAVLEAPDGKPVGTFTEQDAKRAMEQAINGQRVTLDPEQYDAFDSARTIPDYPYGNHRTLLRAWMEYRPKHGFRFVTCTLNPKTRKWNRPKAGTYADLAVMTWNPENGHIEPVGLHYHASADQIDQFESRHGHLFTDAHRHMVRLMRAARVAESKVTWTIRTRPLEPGEQRQTMEQQARIIGNLTAAAYRGELS